MPLYLVCWDSEEGDSLDYFIQADTCEEALNFWASSVHLFGVPKFKEIFNGEVLVYTISPEIFNKPNGVIQWDHATCRSFEIIY